MSKLAPPLVALLLLLAIACNDDGSDDGVVATVSPETPEASPSAAGNGAGGETTPTSEPEPGTTATQPPEGSETPEPDTDDGETPAPEPDPEGTPAVGPASISDYAGMSFDSGSCTYNPRTSLADCPDYGVYSVSPPLTGQDITCSLFVDDDEPVLVFCRSKEPMDARYYEIQ